jgi:hypothetical protein
MDIFLLDTRFSRYHSNPNVYTKKAGIHIIILVLYVDDLILICTNPKLLTHVKSNLRKKFEMTYLGYLHYFLGLQVLQTSVFPFPSLSMLVTFFTAFIWIILKYPPLPSNLDSNLLSLVLLPNFMPLYIIN